MAAPTSRLDDGWPNVSADGPLKGCVSAAATSLLDDSDGNDDDDDEGLRHNSTFPGKSGASKSMVDNFDETLSLCFGNASTSSGSIDAVTVVNEDTLLRGDEIWTALTKSFGQVMPLDWKHSRICALHMPIFNMEEKPGQTGDVTAELSDDEELREQLDMHSIIVSCIGEEPLFTAEQVIEEIEEMMQDSLEFDAEQNPSQSDLSILSVDVQRPKRSLSYEDRVRTLNVAELNERLEEAEASIRSFSEELVQHLALRDELVFEKEVKNSFISALIDVQNRQKEHRETLKKKKKLKGAGGLSQGHPEKTLVSRFSMDGLSSIIQNSFRQTFGSGCGERQYLTTIIPYEKKGHPPSIEDLQILIKILHAMRDDSDKVPGLLTDYILKAVV
ncbi:fasciculation and elongation protein zeta-2 isoform X3 [Dunckerocampus dactyliophorus]|uniref:fasciculation and elongation protein zeta-2 isoform X3 n=1 Tax=Dunckerocampus dactyliophorus TaxID=161453 RepID=UPI002405D2CD|nr:fasciculation and elongation protein zeta-2 isoform X3 [Dunckerocampus dactyliophorus]XP_054638876.1 fasciculation and elongation protein zeta-2 isoform X3 [Dunckerocampus dactyliophorus]